MTEIDKNDTLLKKFFSENKQEIVDNGFSHRVIRRLPDYSHRLVRIWTASILILSTTLFFWLDGPQAIWKTLREVFFNMIQYQSVHLDMKSLIIVAAVLLFLATRKVMSADC